MLLRGAYKGIGYTKAYVDFYTVGCVIIIIYTSPSYICFSAQAANISVNLSVLYIYLFFFLGN